jgi:predicted dehydrogenase
MFNVALVGAGAMAGHHAAAFSDIEGVAIAGVYSRTRARAEELASRHNARVFDSIEAMYEATHADLVVVAVPELEVNAIACRCFEFPWNVMLEKPPGFNVADAESIANAARARQRRVFVGLNRRFYSSTRAALDDLAQRDSQRLITAIDQQDQSAARAAGQPEPVVDNWMFANSIHVIDYLRLFGRGNVDRITRIRPWDPSAPGYVVAAVEFSSGDLGLYQGVWNGPGPWAVTVNDDQRRWELRPLEQAAFQRKGERTVVPVERDAVDERFKPGIRPQAEAAVAACRGAHSSMPTLDDAIETMRLIDGIFRGSS